MPTLEQVITQYGDWAADPIATNLDLIRRLQAELLTEVEAHTGQPNYMVPVLDYLRSMAEADPTDPEVAQYFLVRSRYTFVDHYSVIHSHPKVPKPRGRPAKPASEQRRLRSLYLTDAEYAAVQARIPPGEEFSDWVRRQLLSE